ncbi:hypothetical protein [Telluribacter sp.]|jgi:hypothetical protein|uniref:hypothetical protein n=1 Tax=Telluribacter sp. TaxID=1978767 RepID=UPI002E10369A|nr:hypothetical protein [Telluribacter sp.]
MKDKRIRLDDLERNVPFTVPEGYFERLPSDIQARIPVQPERARPLISWSWQRSVVLAGALSLIMVLVWVTYPETQGPLGQEPLSQISDEAIIEYLGQQDISYYDLSEHQVVQGAFATDSTILNYLDGLDEEVIRQQLIDTAPVLDAI